MALNRWILYFAVWWVGREIAILYYNKQKISFRNLKYPLLTILLGAIIMKISQIVNEGTVIAELTKWEYINLYRIFFVLIIALLWYKVKWIGFNFTFGLFKSIAPISYGIYISHMLLSVQASYFDFIGNVYIRYSLYLLVCILVSYLIERVIYAKVFKWSKKIIFN